MNIGSVIVKFGADISGFIGGMKSVIGSLGGFSAAAAGVVLVGAGLAVVLGVAATTAAANFQQGLNRLVTGAGDVTDNMGKMGQSILGTSVATGVLTGQLLPAMYQIISAGQRGAQAQDTLRVAAMGSVTEQAKVVDVAKALTTAMTDYGTTQFNATQFMNGYTRATQLGKVTLEQLSNSMGPLLPLAKNTGISFADVAGAMSTMTNAGIPAERAATSLRFLMQSLEVPTKKAKDAMAAMGLNSVAVGNEMKVSLPGALEMIYKAALKAGPEGSVPFNRALSDMVGGQRSLQAMLSLTGTHFKTFSDDSNAVAAAMNLSKTAVLGWDVAQQNANVQADRAKAAIAALGILIGTALLPALTSVLSHVPDLVTGFENLATGVGKVITWFQQGSAPATILSVALLAIAGGMAAIKIGAFIAAIPGLVAGFIAWAAAAWTAAAGTIAATWPLFLLGAAVVVVIAIIILAIRNWGAIAHWIQGVWAAVIGWLVGAWQSLVGFATSVFNTVKNAIVTAFNATIAWITNAWHAAIAFIVSIWQTLVGFASSVFNAVKSAIMSVVQSVITWLVNAWNTCVQAIAAAFAWLYAHNTYWKALVDFIRNVVQAVVSWLVTAWQNCITFIVGIWNTLSGAASAAWNAVSSTIMGVVNAVIGWLNGQWHAQAATLDSIWASLAAMASSVWNAITSFITSAVNAAVSFLKSAWTSAAAFLNGVWNTIKQAVVSAWNFIVAQFAAAWGRISGPLASLGASIGNFFANLANMAINWGANIIRGIISGINSMIGAVAGAASNIASTITGILGFHSPPPQGPAHNADTWMPNMVNMMTKGLHAGIPSMAAQASLLMAPVVNAAKAPLGSPGTLPVSGTAQDTGDDRRPVTFYVGTQQYNGFVENLGRDVSKRVIIQKGGLR